MPARLGPPSTVRSSSGHISHRGRHGLSGAESDTAANREDRSLRRGSAPAAWRASRTPGLGRTPAPPAAPPRGRLPILSGGACSSVLPGHTQLHSSSHSPRSEERSSPAARLMSPNTQHSGAPARPTELQPAAARPRAPRAPPPRPSEPCAVRPLPASVPDAPIPPMPPGAPKSLPFFRETPKVPEEAHPAILPPHLFG